MKHHLNPSINDLIIQNPFRASFCEAAKIKDVLATFIHLPLC